jgi:hypothetical protein
MEGKGVLQTLGNRGKVGDIRSRWRGSLLLEGSKRFNQELISFLER